MIKNHEPKKKFEGFKALTSILESVDAVDIIGATTTSVTLLVTVVGLVVAPISAGTACILTLGNKVIHRIVFKNSLECKKQYEKNQKVIESFDKFHTKMLQNNLMIKTNMNLYKMLLVNTLMKRK